MALPLIRLLTATSCLLLPLPPASAEEPGEVAPAATIPALPEMDGGIPEPAPDAAPAALAPATIPAPEATDGGTPEPEGNATPEAASAEATPDAGARPPIHLETTIVGTQLARTAGSAHIMREKQLERFKYDDAQQILKDVPGVYARGEDGFGLRPNIGIRGVNPDRSKKLTLLEDGISFAPATYSAPAAYYFPIMTRMTQVKVIKGPAAIAYGPQTVGGAVDLITRPIPTSFSGSFDGAYGGFGYGKAHTWVGTTSGPFGFLIEGIHLRSDGFKQLPDKANTGFTRNEWMVKGAYSFAPGKPLRHELQLKLTYSDEVSNETYLGLTDADFRENPDRRYAVSALDQMRNHRTQIVLSHLVELLPNLSLTTTANRADFARVWRKVNAFRGADLFSVLRNPGSAVNSVYYDVLSGRADSSSVGEEILIGPNNREFVTQGLQSRLRWDVSTGPVDHRIETGLRLHNDGIDRRHSQDAFDVAGGQLIPAGFATEVTAFNNATTTAIAGHVIDAVTWNALTVTGGFRYEGMQSWFVDRAANKTTQRWAQAFLPGIGAFYSFHESFGVLAGAYRGFSPPAPGSDKSVEPELSTNYEAGARFARGRAQIEAIAFYNDYQNLTDVCTLSSGCVDANLDRQFDAGKARIYGVEAFARHELPVGPVRIPLLLAYTFTRAESLNSFESDDPIYGSVEKGDELPYVPQHQVTASAGVEGKLGGGYVSASYVSQMREEAGHEALSKSLMTDAQLVLDASGNVRIFKWLSVYANLRNALNGRFIVSRRPFGARPNAPRSLQVGVKLDF